MNKIIDWFKQANEWLGSFTVIQWVSVTFLNDSKESKIKLYVLVMVICAGLVWLAFDIDNNYLMFLASLTAGWAVGSLLLLKDRYGR